MVFLPVVSKTSDSPDLPLSVAVSAWGCPSHNVEEGGRRDAEALQRGDGQSTAVMDQQVALYIRCDGRQWAMASAYAANDG